MNPLKKEIDEKIYLLFDQGYKTNEIANMLNVSYSAVYTRKRARNEGFISPSQLRISWLKKKGFSSFSDYKEFLAEKKGFNSYEQYRIREKRKKREKNSELSDLISLRLEELGKSQTWLAQQIGVSKQSVNYYTLGYSRPSKKILESLYDTLGVSIDDQV
jgi:predicted transcriptional regulator